MGYIKKAAVLLTVIIMSVISALIASSEDLSGGVVTEIEGSRFLANIPEETLYVGDDLSYIDYIIEVVESQNMIITKDDVQYTLPLSLEWDTSAADTSKAGSFAVTGTIIPPEGCIFAEGVMTMVELSFIVVESDDEPKEIIDVDSIGLYVSGELITAGDTAYMEEYVQYLSDSLSYIVGRTENGEEAVLFASEVDAHSVDINTPGEYIITVYLELYPEYQDLFILPDELSFSELPICIADAQELTLWISGCTEDMIQGGYQGTEESYPTVHAAVNTEAVGNFSELDFQPVSDEMVLCGNGVFRIIREQLSSELHYYFYLDDGTVQSNYIHIYDNGDLFFYESMGGDRDGGDLGGVTLPDLVQPVVTEQPDETSDKTEAAVTTVAAVVQVQINTTSYSALQVHKYENMDMSVQSEGKSTDQKQEDGQTAAYPKIENDASEEHETAVKYESSTDNKDVISGQRLLLMLESEDEAVFPKHGITVKIPSEAFELLGISADDMFGIEIIKKDLNEFSVEITLNDEELTGLKGMKIMVPCDGNTGDIRISDNNGQYISDGIYDEISHTVSFFTDKTGIFILSGELLTDTSEASDTDYSYAVLLIIIMLLGISGAGYYLYKMKK